MNPTGNITEQVKGPWGLRRLTSNGPLPQPLPAADGSGFTYQRGYEYKYYGNACGQGVTIYILDDIVRADHFQFKKVSKVIYDANGRPTMQREDETARIEQLEDFTATRYHGAFAAAIAAGMTYGVARSADVVSVDLVPGDELVNVMAGVALPAVLNISNEVFPDIEGTTRCIVKLIRQGIHVVVAAGNHNLRLGPLDWKLDELTAAHGLTPADAVHLESVIWVGASTSTDEKRFDSNFGPRIDLFAPGDDIISATNQGDRATNPGPWGGTSFAAPYVTGIIGCLLSHPDYRNLTPAAMKAKILAMAWPDAMQGVDGDTTTRLASCRMDRWTLG